MKMRKKTLALLLFSAAFICSVGVSAFVLWQADVLNLPGRQEQPAVSQNVRPQTLYPAPDANGLWGYIDEQGVWRIAPKYQQANAFEGKAAWVRQDELWGAINADGEFIVQPEYAEIKLYCDGDNRFIAAFGSKLSAAPVNSSLYDINGQKLFGLAGELRAPSSGLMPFSYTKGGQTTWGYINPHSEIVIEPVYAEVGEPSGNYALVKDTEGQTLLLNIYAKTGVPVQGEVGLNAVGSRLVLVQDEQFGLFGYRDADGNMAIDYTYVQAEAFRGGAALAAVLENREDNAAALFGLLTPEGVWAAEPQYLAGEYLDNGVYALKLAGEPGYRLLNALGEDIVGQTVYRYDDWQNGLLACYTAEHTLFINRRAEVQPGLVLGLQPGVFRLGELFGVRDENGQSWFNEDGQTIYSEGRDRELGDGVRLVTALQNADPAYMVYYPQIEAAGGAWQRLNTELAEQALGDYYNSYAAGREVNFTVYGDYQLLTQGEVMTVVQKLTVDDSWQKEGGQQEQVISSVCFDKRTGRQYRLGDLFKADVNWRSELLEPLLGSYSLLCAAEAQPEQPEMLVTLQKRLPRNVDFALGSDGLQIYFGLSDGTAEAIPLFYEDIEALLNTDGALWQGLGLDLPPAAAD